jgi:AcrR family transcriptional regulator
MVYKRFPNKEALRLALALRFQKEQSEYAFSAPTPEEACRRYVRFAEKHPQEYKLLWLTWVEIFHPENPRPTRAWFMRLLANRLGGDPEDYAELFYALFLLAHGAATLLTIPGDEIAHAEVRENFALICDAMLKNPKQFPKQNFGSPAE